MAETAQGAKTITPHDSNALSPVPDALYVGTGGTIVYRAKGSSADVTTSAPDGGHILCRVQYVRATGTTATGIVGYFL